MSMGFTQFPYKNVAQMYFKMTLWVIWKNDQHHNYSEFEFLKTTRRKDRKKKTKKANGKTNSKTAQWFGQIN